MAVSFSAVRRATHRALANRERLLQDYPDWQDWRREASAIKTEVIGRLEELLSQLERRVQDWGGQVFWAQDAEAAAAHVLAVAQAHRVTKVVKSKSMTSEEVRLNSRLAAAGLQVTETDLGEFIVQLAGHPPAHLTAPALHLDRVQIAEIFSSHLGLTCPPDPEALTQLACRHLKPRYGEAHMGITGVNFAAAAEGVLIMVENEGNLRLSATMPKVHLALMGLEKLVPSLSDLAVFLRLLPASATGQRLTSLVHFLKGRKTGPEGSQAFYLVILDNGRRRLATDPELRDALACLRCGACLNICPVFQAGAAHVYGRVYPGAIGILLAAYLGPRGDISDLCTQCGACGDICPAGIRLPDMILLVRSQSERFRGLRLGASLAGQTLAHPRLYRGLEHGLRRLTHLVPGLKAPSWGDAVLAPESFYARQGRWPPPAPGASSPVSSWPGATLAGPANLPEELPWPPATSGRPGSRPAAPTLAPDLLEERLREAASGLHQIRGPAHLAQFLSQTSRPPVWLEDHPCLQPVAQALAELGVPVCLAARDWAPEADTVVTVALGAVSETGSVLAPGGLGASCWLPLRARRHLLLVASEQAHLGFSQALRLTGQADAPLVSWLTGPTRTADIEKFLVLGAQGPMELDMVLYDEA